MAKKLFVGGLPWEMKNEDLEGLFAQAGKVASATIITDKFSGKSKGFGFVEFESDADADNAVSMFNGSDQGGRKITVNEARPMREHPPRRSFDRGRRDY